MTRQWGGTNFLLSHGFGGLDRGLTLTAHSPVYIADTWATYGDLHRAFRPGDHPVPRYTDDDPPMQTRWLENALAFLSAPKKAKP